MQSVVGSIGANLERMSELLEIATGQGADIACFPELCITGYGIKDTITSAALDIKNPAVSCLLDMSKRCNTVIVAGMAERDTLKKLYATQLVVHNGHLLGSYRKIHLGPPEKPLFNPGDALFCFQHLGWKIGLQLCYDSHFPELTTMYALHGADLILISHASPGKTPEGKIRSWLKHLTARAYDNSLYVAAVNAVGENGEGLRFPGTALVIDPAGEATGKFTSNRDAVWICSLYKEKIEAVRNHTMRYFLPNRRPEVYRLA